MSISLEVAPEKQTRGLRTTLLAIELLWTPIAKRLMQALAVVEHLDILRDGIAGFGLMLEVLMPDELVLERAEEALDRSIVTTVSLATHTGDHVSSV